MQILTQAKVSAHYLIPKIPKIKNGKPVIFNLVPENKIAWHTGLSNWNGKLNLNDSSVGIEIVNKGFTEDMLCNKVWNSFNEQQISAIINLSKDIRKRYNITPDNVLTHSDIAPLRMYDPGKLFPCKRLAKLGIVACLDELIVKKYLAGRSAYTPGSVLVIQKYLQNYWYDKIPQSGNLMRKRAELLVHFSFISGQMI